MVVIEYLGLGIPPAICICPTFQKHATSDVEVQEVERKHEEEEDLIVQ